MQIRRNILRSVVFIAVLGSIRSAFAGLPPVIHVESPHSADRLSFGNLRPLDFSGGNGHYTLNGELLQKISSDSVHFVAANPEDTDHPYRVRASFLKTVLLVKSRPIFRDNQALMESWAKEIPLVAHILKDEDSIGSLKPIIYELLDTRKKSDLQLQEELVLLWSSDHSDESNIGRTDLMPPLPFLEPIADVQYRGHRGRFSQLTGKIILQILYLKDHGKPLPLGALVIVSKGSGEYEFYLVPRECLGRILIATP